MKIKPMLIAGLFALGGQTCMSQTLLSEVITSAGSSFSNSVCSLNWTMGEPISETDTYDNNSLTQGFQQPSSIIVTSVNNQKQMQGGDVSVYPNPSSASVFIQNNDEGKTLNVELMNMSGKEVFKKTLTDKQEQFDMSEFANGIYFLRVYNTSNQLIQTLKIDKIK
jgi:hypothetical protein